MKEIKNDEYIIEKNEEFNIKDVLEDIIMCERSISSFYSEVISEISNKYLSNKIINMFEENKHIEREIINYLFYRGWSSVIQEDEDNIEKTYQKYCTKLSELS